MSKFVHGLDFSKLDKISILSTADPPPFLEQKNRFQAAGDGQQEDPTAEDLLATDPVLSAHWFQPTRSSRVTVPAKWDNMSK